MRITNYLLFLIGAAACSSSTVSPPTMISMDFTRAVSLYDAPFPSDDLLTAGGLVDMSKFPSQDQALVIQQAVQLIGTTAKGFSSTAGVFFSATASVDPTSLPNVTESTADGASVFLLDTSSGKKIPVSVSYDDDGGPYGAQFQITVLPYQGVPLAPQTIYAAVITRGVLDALGRPLAVSSQMQMLLAGTAPPGISSAMLSEMTTALSVVTNVVDASNIAGVAVYKTDAPLAGMQSVVTDMLGRVPQLNAPLAPNEVFSNFCVYSSTINMPDYQTGTPPYTSTGGEWAFDAQGNPIFQGTETANLVVTVPQIPMPPNGFPTVVFSRTGAGGNRPLVDRGVQPAPNEPAITPGTGPALEFARVGFAGISIDGPLGGLRNPVAPAQPDPNCPACGDPSQEDFLIFNISNPGAIRDNIRESAAELVLTAHILDGLSVDASACPTLANANVKFDVTKLGLMGHSMGATISPLSSAFEPRFGVTIMSGCGGSFIENILYKELPVLIRPLAEVLIGYPPIARKLTEGDAALSLVQWAAEAADPPTYGARILNGSGAPHNVLVFQGIVDHYIMPPMANANDLAFGLDLGAAELDNTVPEIADFTPLGALFPLSGRSAITLPAQGNYSIGNGQSVTAVVSQHLSDGIEDGHEIMFQEAGPKYQYRCFLASYASGGAVVVPPSMDSDDLCPLP